MSRSGSGKPDPDLEGVELLLYQKGGSSSFWGQNGAFFEWSGSGLYEPNYWDPLVEQSVQISYMINRTSNEPQTFSCCLSSDHHAEDKFSILTNNVCFSIISLFFGSR